MASREAYIFPAALISSPIQRYGDADGNVSLQSAKNAVPIIGCGETWTIRVGVSGWLRCGITGRSENKAIGHARRAVEVRSATSSKHVHNLTVRQRQFTSESPRTPTGSISSSVTSTDAPPKSPGMARDHTLSVRFRPPPRGSRYQYRNRKTRRQRGRTSSAK
jgi:hypothetical protein